MTFVKSGRISVLPTISSTFFRPLRWLIVCAFLVGCQPDPAERVAAARSFIDASDYAAAIVELKNAVQEEPDNVEARLLLADASIVVADFDTAETQYTRALELGADRVDVWFGLGRAMIANGKAVNAMETVLPNLERMAVSDRHFALIGDLFMTLGNDTDAKPYYERALALDADSDGGVVGSAAVAAASGDVETASRILDDALARRPDSLAVWRAKGNLLQAVRRFDESAAAYAEAIRLETPDTPRADRFQTRASLVTVLIDARRFDDAGGELQKLRQRFPRHPLISYLAGRVAFGLEDFELAQTEFQRYLSDSPDDSHGQAMMGVVSFRQHNYGQAEMWLTRAIRAQVGGEAIRRLLGETKLQLNKPREALETLRAAQATGQSDAVLLAMLGRAEVGVGDTEAAIRYFEESLDLDAGNPLVGMALAASYISAGRFDDGIGLLESLPDVESTLYHKKVLLIGSFLRSGQENLAVAEVEKLLTDDPDNPLHHAIAGTVWQSLDRTERARGHFEKVLELEPDNVAANFSLGRLDIAAGNFGDAARRFERTLDLNASFAPALYALVATANATGDAAGLERRIDAAVAASPDAFTPRALQVRHFLSTRRVDEALAGVDQLRARFADDPRVEHLHGVVLAASGQSQPALRYLGRAADADPDNPEYLFDLANAQLLASRFDAAFATISRFLDIRADDVRALAVLTGSAIGAGRTDEAHRAVSDYLSREPGSGPALMMLGDLDLERGDAAAALRSFERVAEMDWDRRIAMQLSIARAAAGAAHAPDPIGRWVSDNPEDDGARQLHARLLETSGRTQEAVAEYETLLERGTADAVSLNNLAWHYHLAGRADALDLAERAHELDGDNASIADTFGWLLLENGRVDRALTVLERAADRAGDNPEIQYHLAAALARSGDREAAGRILSRLLGSPADFPSRPDAERLAATL